MTKALVISRFVYVWGYWFHHPYVSARRDTFPIPPPSTIIGAFAAALARALDVEGVSVGELVEGKNHREIYVARLLAEATLEAYYRVLDGFGMRMVDFARLFQAPYQREENIVLVARKGRSIEPMYRNIMNWFGVKEVAKVYAPTMKSEAALLVDLGKLALLLHRDEMNAKKLLLRAAWSITRLGPQEGLVSVYHAEIVDDVDAKCRNVDDWTELSPLPCPYHTYRRGSDPQRVPIVYFMDWRNARMWSYAPRDPSVIGRRPYVVPLEASFWSRGMVTPFRSCASVYRFARRLPIPVIEVRVDGDDDVSHYPYPS